MYENAVISFGYGIFAMIIMIAFIASVQGIKRWILALYSERKRSK